MPFAGAPCPAPRPASAPPGPLGDDGGRHARRPALPGRRALAMGSERPHARATGGAPGAAGRPDPGRGDLGAGGDHLRRRRGHGLPGRGPRPAPRRREPLRPHRPARRPPVGADRPGRRDPARPAEPGGAGDPDVRETFVVVAYAWLLRRGIEMRVDMAGKVSSALTMVATGEAILLDQAWVDALFWAAVALAAVTLLNYSRQAAKPCAPGDGLDHPMRVRPRPLCWAGRHPRSSDGRPARPQHADGRAAEGPDPRAHRGGARGLEGAAPAARPDRARQERAGRPPAGPRRGRAVGRRRGRAQPDPGRAASGSTGSRASATDTAVRRGRGVRMYCPECGFHNSDAHKYCGRCGAC